MKHLSEGQLQTFYDGALSHVDHRQIQEHLDSCSKCAQIATAVKARHTSVYALMTDLGPREVRTPVSPQNACQRFNAYVHQKSEDKMSQKLFSRRYRSAWAAATIVILLALSLTLPPVRTLASNFLALFRVQKIEFVEFNPLNLPDEKTLESAALRIEDLVSNEVVFEQHGEPQTVDTAGAKTTVDFPVRFPSTLENTHQIDIQPGMHIVMQIDLPRVQALLDGLGYQNAALPDSLDGAEVSVDIAPSVTASYGACEDKAGNDCVLFVQMPNPDVNAPPDLDIAQLGHLYLQMLGMNAREATRFSKNIDWTTTLVVPIPSNQAKYQDVAVDGVMGTYIQAQDPKQGPEYVLMWLKNDIVYALIGSGDKASALEIASSLE